MDVPADLLAQFCRFTNATEAVGKQLLLDSALDLNNAVQAYFAILDAGGDPSAEHPSPDSAEPTAAPPTVRAPPPLPAPPAAPSTPPTTSRQPSGPPPPSFPSSYIDGLRPSPPGRARDNNPNDRSSVPNPFQDYVPGDARSEGLAALFQPPTHLIFPDSFHDAQEAGRSQLRWLLVNIQRNDVFACHTMNRDVWSDPDMQQLLAAHFIFWQRDDSKAGPYSQFYNITNYPHIAVIDPRNGERVRVWGDDGNTVDKAFLIEQLGDFVSGNSLDSDAIIRGSQPRPGSRATRPASADAPQPPTAASTAEAQQMEEDAMLAAAISASMEPGSESADGSAEIAAAGAASETANASAASAANLNGMGVEASDREFSRLLSATDPSLSRNRSLRAEQDDAFMESLAIDRAKEASQRSEQERLESERRAEELEEKQRTERIEMKRKRVPDEPATGTTDKVTELAIRIPNGKRLIRRFHASDNVGNVYDFLDSECEELNDVDYELMLTFPRKSYSDREALLETLPQKAALVVHLKN